MPVKPKLRRIVAPPGPPPLNLGFPGGGSGGSGNATHVAYEAVRSHTARTDPASCATDPPTCRPSGRMQLLTVHPSQPLVAYYVEDAPAKVASPSPSLSSADSTNNTNVNISVKLIQVQHLQTRNVLWTCYLSDIASMLFDYDPIAKDSMKRFSYAMKTLGQIQSMQFFDPSTLYFTGMADHPSSSLGGGGSEMSGGGEGSGAVERWQTLLVQFDKRIVMLNLRKGPTSIAIIPPSKGRAARNYYSPILCHLTKETGLNSHPSSNALPLTKSLLLLGCGDGTFKCYDWKKSKLQKSIKGLGKNDWIVHLIAANRYPSLSDYQEDSNTGATSTTSADDDDPNNSTNNNLQDNGGSNTKPQSVIKVRRFITVTKKGTAYLIEVVVSPDGGIDIRPPLARFEGGASPNPIVAQEFDFDQSSSNIGDIPWEHQLLNYDPDRDIFMWGLPANYSLNKSTKNKEPQKMFCWDLQIIIQHLQQSPDGGGGLSGGDNGDNNSSSNTTASTSGLSASTTSTGSTKTGVYKPEPTIVIQFPFEAEVAAFPAWSHAAFPEDAIICAVVTSKGDLHIMGATRTGTSGTGATVLASAITSTSIRAVIQRDTDEMTTPPILQLYSIGCASLWDSSVLLLGSNVGVVMVDFEREFVIPGARHNHFGAGLGSLGKSVLYVQHSSAVYGSVDAFRANPVGPMEIKNTYDVYESPVATHLPMEIQKRPFRLPPTFLPSPSGIYLCLFWGEEMRYEVLHVPSVLQRVSQRGNDSASYSAMVATGTGVCSFAWVGENDVYAIIHSPDADKLGRGTAVDAATPISGGDGNDFAALSAQKLKDLADIRNLGNNLKDLANVKELAVNTAKGTTKVVTSTAKIATGVTTTVAGAATNIVGTTVQKTTKVFSLSRLRGKKKNTEAETSAITAEEDIDEKPAVMTPTPMMQPGMFDPNANARSQVKKAHVEFKELVPVETNQSTLTSSISPATASTLGELNLRGGNRIPPNVLFGGPVLCVACRSEEEEGMAYFYTPKKDATDKSASSYVSSGPSLPYPDLVVWDDDGKLCCVVMGSRVGIYLSDQGDFVLLGTVRVGSPADPDGAAISVKFVHGVLYCCTRNSIECVFLGDMSGGICHLDSFTIASTSVHTLPSRSILTSYSSLTPPTLPMPLNHPVVLGYQSGSLIVSTVRGLIAIPLNHPLLRIGCLLAAGQSARAAKWFDAVPESDQEELATFLERRGYPELAMDLPGLSLETMVDFAIREGNVERLEMIVEAFGVSGLRSIDMGRGVSAGIFGPEECSQSVVVCVGAFLLSHGRTELVRRLATECLKFGEAKKDAFVLATLMLNMEGTDARRIIGSAVRDPSLSDDWALANYVRKHIIPPRSDKA